MKLCVICNYNVCLPLCLSVEGRAERKREINPDSVIECSHPSSETEEFANLSLLCMSPLLLVCVCTYTHSLPLSLSLSACVTGSVVMVMVIAVQVCCVCVCVCWLVSSFLPVIIIIHILFV